jgi:hypothetical protein
MSDNTSTAPKSELSVENHTEVRIAPSYDHAGITIYKLNPDYVSMIARRLRQDNLFSTLL